MRPDSVLDLGSNRGWYAQLAASVGVNNVLAFDMDETAVNRLYRDVKSQEKAILGSSKSFTRNADRSVGGQSSEM